MLHKHTKAILMASCMAFAPAYALAQTQQPAGQPQTQQQQGQTTQRPMDQQRAGERPMDRQTTGQQRMDQQRMGQPHMDRQQMGQWQTGQQQAMEMIAAPRPGQMMGSDLRGTTIYGANNENIGEIDDVLIDRQGQVVAVIVGVGGFLGIGEKDVAIPFQALEIVDTEATAGATVPRTTGTTPLGDRATDQERQRATAERAERVGEPATAPRTGTRTTAVERGTMRPERIVLRGMTKADLEAAPKFRSEAR